MPEATRKPIQQQYATILTGFQPTGTYPGPTHAAKKKLYNVRIFHSIYTATFNRAAMDVTGQYSMRHIKVDKLMMIITSSANNGPQCSSR